MKIFCLTFTLAAFFAIASAARADYEIRMTITSPEGPKAHEVVARVKGERMRADFGDGDIQITDCKTGQRLLLDEKTKQATDVTDLVKTSAERKDSKKPKPKPVPTGKKESVAGHDAEEYTCDIGLDMVVNLWIAEDYPKEQAAAIAVLYQLSGQQTLLSVSDMAALPGVITRVVVKDKGDVEADLVIKSVTETKVDDKEFEIPADYTVKKLPARPERRKEAK